MTTRSYTRYDKYVTEKEKKHEGVFHALSRGETQGKEVCYRRRYGRKKGGGDTRHNTQKQPTNPPKSCTRSLSTGEQSTVGQIERYVFRVTHTTHFCYTSTGPLHLLFEHDHADRRREPTKVMTHPTNHTPQAHTRTHTAATPRTTPPDATHTNTKGYTAHTHTQRPRRRAPRALTTTTSGRQPGVAGNHAHGPRPGVARDRPRHPAADPSQEWRGPATNPHGQERQGSGTPNRRPPAHHTHATTHTSTRVRSASKCITDGFFFHRCVARLQQKKMKNQEKDAQPEEIKRKIDFSDLRNPRKKFYAAVWRGRKV